MKALRPWIAIALLAVLAAAALWYWRAHRDRLQVVEYALNAGKDTPIAIAAAPDGSVWFTLDSADVLGVVRGGKVERVARGAASVEPAGIGVDAHGNVFATDPNGIAITKLAANGQVSAIALGTPIARLGRLAVAADDAVWFAEATRYSFTRLKDGVLTRNNFDSVRGGPYGVAAAKDGAVWGSLQSGNQLVRIGVDGKLTEFDVPTRGGGPTDIAVDANGDVWFLEFRGNKLGRFSAGKFTEYAMPEGVNGLSGLAVGRDGTVWFGVLRAGSLGRWRDGKIEILRLPRERARPYSLTADATGAIWYADISGYVGKVVQ